MRTRNNAENVKLEFILPFDLMVIYMYGLKVNSFQSIMGPWKNKKSQMSEALWTLSIQILEHHHVKNSLQDLCTCTANLVARAQQTQRLVIFSS